MDSAKGRSRRGSRRMTKEKPSIRMPSVKYPKRLREGEDAQEDVTAANDTPAQYMNQSVFSMIAAAGSKVDFHARFDEGSSDSEDETEDRMTPTHTLTLQSDPSSSLEEISEGQHDVARSAKSAPETVVALDDDRFRSLPKLNLSRIQEQNYMSQSTILPPSNALSEIKSTPKGLTPRDVPVMSQMLEAQAEQLLSSPVSPDVQDFDRGQNATQTHEEPPVTLVRRLKEIFGFAADEEVISEYPCWLLQSVLLQGYMYITRNHICFYAYLPKKSDIVAKSGHLTKRGRTSTKYKRYWFTLRGDVLSYYTDQSELYFPSGNIDLRYGISTTLAQQKDSTKDVREFYLVTHQRSYHFKADSAASAKEWVKTLQKVIFRSHNDGDSVKISLPVENLIDIEESPVLEFADTFKVRVFDSDETYAIDEYFFSFFSFGKDALNVLRSMIDETVAHRVPEELLCCSPQMEGSRSLDISQGLERRHHRQHCQDSQLDPGTPILHDHVRATLIPASPSPTGPLSQRPSVDRGRSHANTSRKSLDICRRDFSRSSFDRGRRLASASRTRQAPYQMDGHSPGSTRQASTSSFVRSLDRTNGSSVADLESNDTEAGSASGSQILQRSDVFQFPHPPNISQTPLRRPSTQQLRSDDFAITSPTAAKVQIQPPTREQTSQSPLHSPLDTHIRKSRESQSPSPTLQHLVRAGGYPLQKAAGFAGFLRQRSKQMGNMLASESMGYVEKVSGMWAGGHRHYGRSLAGMPIEGAVDPEVGESDATHEERYRMHFALPDSEKLQATYFGFLHRVLPLYGKLYVSSEKLCFRSLLPGTKTKLVLPLQDIENINKEKGFRFGYSGLVLVIRGHEELFFEFGQREIRDDCAITLLELVESIQYVKESELAAQDDLQNAIAAKAEHKMLQEARQRGHNEHDIKMPQSADDSKQPAEPPLILFDDPRVSILNFKPTESLRITCLTIGSRGDVQPYIALSKRLLEEGHKPKIATHAEFEPWIKGHGIAFDAVDGDPAELMRICVENGMFTVSFLREASLKFRSWIDELLTSAWKACQDTDILIESPSAMAGIHIAEALGVPYFRAFTMPWTRTRAYPHAFAVPEHKRGGAYNYMTYVMFDNFFWKAIAGQVNRWRKNELGLPSTSIDKMQPNKVPFLYNFSPCVVVPPLDYSDWIRVTGYWFLDESSSWTPSKELTDFIAQARVDNKKLVYIGFGSIVVSDPAALTKTVVESVLKADVRAILSKGWSDRLGNQDATVPELPLPSQILQIKSAPHDWLFKQIDAAAHHGGAGTTGASLRAGLPTVVKPFFGDQFFFGSRLEDLGVGVCLKKLNVSVFSRALWEATHSERMIVKARVLGDQIRGEDGVGMAVQAIYRDLEYARSLIKHQKEMVKNGEGLELGENWTFIGDESDPDLRKRIYEWDPAKAEGAHLHGRRSLQRQSLDLGA